MTDFPTDSVRAGTRHNEAVQEQARPTQDRGRDSMEPGMLILAPFGNPPRPMLWMVTKVEESKNRAIIMCHRGYGHWKVEVKTLALPDDWKIIDNEYVVHLIETSVALRTDALDEDTAHRPNKEGGQA